MMLDMFEMCTEELQQKLIPAREAFKAEEDRQLELHPKVRFDGDAETTSFSSFYIMPKGYSI